MAITRFDHLKVNRLDVQETTVAGGTTFVDLANAATDEKAKVSSNDTTPGFLNGKLVAGANVTLTENNNGGDETLTIAAAGGVAGFTGSQNTAVPNNTTNASRLLADATAADADIVISPKGIGAVLANLPDNTVTGGNKRGRNAVDLQTWRAANTDVASGENAVLSGGRDNRASATNSVVCGGRLNSVTGSESTITGGYNNSVTASGATAIGRGHTVSGSDSVCAGSFNFATAQYATCIGGNSNTASGQAAGTLAGQNIEARAQGSSITGGNNMRVESNANYSSIGGGQGNWIYSNATYARIGGGANSEIMSTASYAVIGGGSQNKVSGSYGVVVGGLSAHSTQAYQQAFASGQIAAKGDCQYEAYFVRTLTNSASATTLTSGGTALSSTSKISIESDATYVFTGLITARNQSADESAAYEIKGVIWNNAGTTAFLGTPTITVLAESVAAWDIQLVADDGNDSLNINAVGEAGKNLAWAGWIQLVKIKY
jgi:hypothetical protein